MGGEATRWQSVKSKVLDVDKVTKFADNLLLKVDLVRKQIAMDFDSVLRPA